MTSIKIEMYTLKKLNEPRLIYNSNLILNLNINTMLPGLLLLLADHVVGGPHTPAEVVDEADKEDDVGAQHRT